MALSVSEDRLQFAEANRVSIPKRLEAGDHNWSLDVYRNVKSIWLAIISQSSRTLGEVEIYGCAARVVN
jgi:hypothetical protein